MRRFDAFMSQLHTVEQQEEILVILRHVHLRATAEAYNEGYEDGVKDSNEVDDLVSTT